MTSSQQYARSVIIQHTENEAVKDIPERSLQSHSTKLLVVMVGVVIMVMSILACLVPLVPVSLSMRIGVVMILRRMLRTGWSTGRLHNNRWHRRRRRLQYQADVNVHSATLILASAPGSSTTTGSTVLAFAAAASGSPI